MQLLISPFAAQDLEDIGDYLALDNVARAISFLAELQTQCQIIANNPHGYRKRIELGAELRSCGHGNCVIFFTNDTHKVAIVRILHGSRDITPTSIYPT
jgi:toxin ParE1/3/4